MSMFSLVAPLSRRKLKILRSEEKEDGWHKNAPVNIKAVSRIRTRLLVVPEAISLANRSDFQTAGAVCKGDAIRFVAREALDGDAAARHADDLGVAKAFVAGSGEPRRGCSSG
ncbi:hypothetical protein [Neorhizobium sp. T25_13]|uniref:hypothetical protein n=1 Tax=Neorhizobium sp. T25_13 TaxID=2093830 RepID=UPI00155F0E04|nr:hypothetical protein [Neorhizobium sp. T25_13]